MEIIFNFEQGKRYIQDGDILLFRSQGLIGWFISKYGNGIHSHVGMACWFGDQLECVEFREFKGGRIVSMNSQTSSIIDVFRPVPTYNKIEGVLKDGQLEISIKQMNYNGKLAVNYMRNLTGLPYGWKRIWILAKRKIPVLR